MKIVVGLACVAWWIGAIAVYAVSFMHTERADDTPQLTVDKSARDFGECIAGTRLPCDFTITNGGSTPVAMRTTTSCGCTTADRAARILAPGERWTLDAAVDTTGSYGEIIRAVHVHFTSTSPDAGEQVLTLLIKANVVPKDAVASAPVEP